MTRELEILENVTRNRYARLEPYLCPHCGASLQFVILSNEDAAGHVITPEPGDVSVCARCNGACIFTTDIHLRKITEEEIAALTPAELHDIIVTQHIVAKLKQLK